jgi:type VI secretion system protein ImpI/type VI secretion system protein
MTLTLQVLRCPEQVFPELKRVTGGEFSVGRGPDNDWVLRDDSKYLSRQHCVFGYRNGRWMVADLSASGVLINGAQEPLGKGNTRELVSGDRLALGPYEIEIRLQDDASGGNVLQPRRNAMFGGDFFNAAPPDPSMPNDRPFDTPFGPESLTPEISMHQHFNTPPSAEEWRLPVMPDHASPLDAAFNPAPLVPLPPAAPDAWDLDFPPPGTPPGKTTPPAAHDDDWDLGFPAAGQPPLAAASPGAALHAAPAAIPSARTPNPFDEKDFAPVAPEPFPAAPPPAMPPDKSGPTGAGADALLVAFLEGAGIPDAQPPDAPALMRRLGSALRATVSGIRQALIARAAIKNEFRIEQTMIRARGNNPLKFSADDDDALNALLGLGRRADMAPDAALADALRDMRLHELATMIAVQDAVRALLAQLDPEKLQVETGGLALLPAQKKARAFDSYEKLHRRITLALADDFDSVFGKAFATAYESALRDAQLREPK